MSEGVDPTQADARADAAKPAEHPELAQSQTASELDEADELEQALSALTPHDEDRKAPTPPGPLAPPPVAALQKASRANLLPPPPGVKSRHQATLSKLQFPAPPSVEVQPPRGLGTPTQSAIEQGLGADTTKPLAPTVDFPEDVSASLPELDPKDEQAWSDELRADAPHAPTQDLASPAASDLRASQPASAARPVPHFQNTLEDTNTATGSGSRKILFAIAGIIILAALCWWQLGGGAS